MFLWWKYKLFPAFCFKFFFYFSVVLTEEIKLDLNFKNYKLR